jgi:hypothetical protein
MSPGHAPSSSSSYVQQGGASGSGVNGHGHGQQQVLHQQHQQHPPPATYHYTPEGALRGIAADDPRLQETWQTYMSNVRSIPLFSGGGFVC